MQIELPPEVGRDLVNVLIQKYLPFAPKSEFKERPHEWLIFNLFTQTLRDIVHEQAEKGFLQSKLRKQREKESEHNRLLMSLIAMMLRRLTEDGKVEFRRDVDGTWYDENDVHIMMCHPNDDTMTMQLIVGECRREE